VPGKEGGGERKKMAPIGGPGASVREGEEERDGVAGPALGCLGRGEKKRGGEMSLAVEGREREFVYFVFCF